MLEPQRLTERCRARIAAKRTQRQVAQQCEPNLIFAVQLNAKYLRMRLRRNDATGLEHEARHEPLSGDFVGRRRRRRHRTRRLRFRFRRRSGLRKGSGRSDHGGDREPESGANLPAAHRPARIVTRARSEQANPCSGSHDSSDASRAPLAWYELSRAFAGALVREDSPRARSSAIARGLRECRARSPACRDRCRCGRESSACEECRRAHLGGRRRRAAGIWRQHGIRRTGRNADRCRPSAQATEKSRPQPRERRGSRSLGSRGARHAACCARKPWRSDIRESASS